MKHDPLWETVVLIVAILSLWPCYILKWSGPFWQILPYVMIALLALILVRRWRRLREISRRTPPSAKSR